MDRDPGAAFFKRRSGRVLDLRLAPDRVDSESDVVADAAALDDGSTRGAVERERHGEHGF